jgi:hypothetical protein
VNQPQVVAQAATRPDADNPANQATRALPLRLSRPIRPVQAPPPHHRGQVTISDGKKLSVPSLVGLPIRKVIEITAAAGLEAQINGSGTVREQAPAAGTQVPTGTKIIVRCGR